MPSKNVDVHESPVDLAGLAALAQSGTEIILSADDAPVARIVPLGETVAPRREGLHSGALEAAADFDEPLPDSFWLGANFAANIF